MCRALLSKRGGPRQACKIAIIITRYDNIIYIFGTRHSPGMEMVHGFNNHYFYYYWWCETTDGVCSFFLDIKGTAHARENPRLK